LEHFEGQRLTVADEEPRSDRSKLCGQR
jgi:hypothetical protein